VRYRVEWIKTATTQLMDAWEHASYFEQLAIVAASEQIEGRLGDAADLIGESRENPLFRVVIVDPVTVEYRISPDENLVRVFSIRIRVKRQ
jgi:hypothetical protein